MGEGEVFFTEDANFMVEEFVEEGFFEGDACIVVEEFAEERGIKEERASVEEDTCTDVTTCQSAGERSRRLLRGFFFGKVMWNRVPRGTRRRISYRDSECSRLSAGVCEFSFFFCSCLLAGPPHPKWHDACTFYPRQNASA